MTDWSYKDAMGKAVKEHLESAILRPASELPENSMFAGIGTFDPSTARTLTQQDLIDFANKLRDAPRPRISPEEQWFIDRLERLRRMQQNDG